MITLQRLFGFTGDDQMKKHTRLLRVGVTAIPLLLFATAGTLAAQEKHCRLIRGIAHETIVPQPAAPNDPFGRVLGIFHGDFGGVDTAALTAFLVTQPTFSPATGPSNVMTVRHVFVTGPGDALHTHGRTIYNPGPATLPGQSTGVPSQCPGTPCIVQNPQVLDVVGGTGRYVGATGQLRNLGLGNLNLQQGQGAFTVIYEGEICTSK